MAGFEREEELRQLATDQLEYTFEGTDFDFLGTKSEGKVRDNYTSGSEYYSVTTDRLSAFNIVLTNIPFKGQVLAQTAAWWFDELKDIIDNHLICTPDPNVIVGRYCAPIKLEMVMRGYLTGSTDTSVWTHYDNGVREYCGNKLPDGMKKDQRFETPILTPTTKTKDDTPISLEDAISAGLIKRDIAEQAASASFKLFARGQEISLERGLLLVDTKYEFGIANGYLMLIDEVHTPDSSRYWRADTYEERFQQGNPQATLDKDVARLWYKSQGYTGKGLIPKIPDDVRVKTAVRYMQAYETITRRDFAAQVGPIHDRIESNMREFLKGKDRPLAGYRPKSS